MSALLFLGSVAGSMLGTFLLSRHVYILNALSLIFFGLAAVIAIFFPGQLGLEDFRDSQPENSVSTHNVDDGSSQCSPSLNNSSVDHVSAKKVGIQ